MFSVQVRLDSLMYSSVGIGCLLDSPELGGYDSCANETLKYAMRACRLRSRFFPLLGGWWGAPHTTPHIATPHHATAYAFRLRHELISNPIAKLITGSVINHQLAINSENMWSSTAWPEPRHVCVSHFFREHSGAPGEHAEATKDQLGCSWGLHGPVWPFLVMKWFFRNS